MKQLFTLAFISFTYTAFCQEVFHVGAGGTDNFINGTSRDNTFKPIGYYIYGSVSNRLNSYSGYTGSAQFLNQNNESAKIKMTASSVGLTFNYNVYPFKKGLKVLAGMQLGMVLFTKVGGKKTDSKYEGQFGAFGGVGYEIKRFEIKAIYNHWISDNLFDNTIQLGIGYNLVKG